MIPGRPKRVFRDQPTLREYHEVDIGDPGLARWRGQHREDRRIGMIEQQRPDRREIAQIVLIGRVISVPGYDVKRRMVDLAKIKFSAPFDRHRTRCFVVLESGDRRFEIAPIGETIGADRAAVRQSEGRAIILAQKATRGAINERDLEFDAARQNADFARSNVDTAEFGEKCERALLRNNQKFAVGVVKKYYVFYFLICTIYII